MLLEHRCRKLHIARSIKEGIKILRQNAIDVMVTDFSMPDGTGNLLLKEKKHATVNVLISGHPFEQRQWQEEFGFDAYFLKPCEFNSLLHEMKALLKTHQPVMRKIA
jgi:DNA-binding response OmpR family regulator